MNALPPLSTAEDITARTVADFTAHTPGSKAYAETSRLVLADKTPLAMPFSPALKEAFYPIVSDRSSGARLWDIDGNAYVDILMGLGCNILGHNPDPIRAALEDRMVRGVQIGPQSEIAGETAALFAKLTGHDRVTFSNTGTEAVMTAIRIARAATGRRKIAIFTNAYHGHADQTLFKAKRLEYIRRGALQRAHSGPLKALKPLLERLMITRAVPSFAGVAARLGADVMVLEYNNPRALDILRRQGHKLAAVLVEPVQSRTPQVQPRAFLHGLRAVTQKTGTALIFDEMISGFRVAQGGAQEFFDVRADLATYGKIAGGGLPLSLIAGDARFMDHIDGGAWQFGDASRPQVPTTFFAGTHCRHPLSLTAALAMARELDARGPALQTQLNAQTTQLVRATNTALATAGVPIQFTSFGSFFAIDGSQSRLSPDAGTLLSLVALTRGLHMRPGDRGGFLSTAHGPDDHEFIQTTLVDAAVHLEEAGCITRAGGHP
ncbi:aminotransferase class III-fold pyridoxal phosphate-dependent enzyme [Roseobacter sp.]|uniref:aminotransferase class III-fold pyridoxal phosphate-dependent enzyme n=1 Tax=Roseobacter sp. TaxID=1907202 RepID=UPI00329918CB